MQTPCNTMQPEWNNACHHPNHRLLHINIAPYSSTINLTFTLHNNVTKLLTILTSITFSIVNTHSTAWTQYICRYTHCISTCDFVIAGGSENHTLYCNVHWQQCIYIALRSWLKLHLRSTSSAHVGVQGKAYSFQRSIYLVNLPRPTLAPTTFWKLFTYCVFATVCWLVVSLVLQNGCI